MTAIDAKATARTRARYDRNAPFYDLMTRGTERRLEPARRALWDNIRGPRLLEVGVGTGVNIPYYPSGLSVTAVDLSPRMLKRSRARAIKLGVSVDLREADVQALPFDDATFDTVIATCVFCSVPDPVLGLRELHRVLVAGGELLLLEHVLSDRRVLRSLMRLVNPVVVRMMGANIDRDTVGNVRLAGFTDVRDEDLILDIFKRIDAQKEWVSLTGMDRSPDPDLARGGAPSSSRSPT
jgi:ubiquinone/menaquinone biosynthesis C-methylase UbiE